MIRGREILCGHDSESDGLDGFDEMGHASSKEASFAGVHEHLAPDQISDCINDHRHEQLVRANGAHTIVRPVGGLALRRSLTRDRSPRRAVLHHLDHVGKVIDLRPLVLPVLQTVALLVGRLAALRRAPTSGPPRLLQGQRRSASLARPEFGPFRGFLFSTHQ